MIPKTILFIIKSILFITAGILTVIWYDWKLLLILIVMVWSSKIK